MRTKVMRTALFAMCALFLASCGNINIVKRTYRPGYHIDVVKKNERKKESVENEMAKTTRDQVEEVAIDNELYAPKTAEIVVTEPVLMASAMADAIPLSTSIQPIAQAKPEKKQFKLSDFRWTAKKKNSYKKPMFTSSDHWSAWVAFFAGAASLMFAFIALIVAFFGYAVWPAAIVLGVAAIVFAVIHKKNGWSGEKMRKLGLLFGIIGAGVGLIATIIWAIWWAVIL